jgi:glucan biosynthesis protein C
LTYTAIPFHLWFLGNIFIYVIVFSPLFFWLKRINGNSISAKIKAIFSSPIGLLLVVGLFVAEVSLIAPESFETYAMNWHGFTLGLIAFGAGFMFIYSGQPFWEMLSKYTFFFVIGALAFYLARYFIWDLMGPFYLTAVESSLWIFAVFSLGYRYLNRNSPYLQYLSQAAYPVYILHMLFLNLSCTMVFGWDLPVALQFLLVLLFTFLGCFITYECIRRVNFLRPLFGLKIQNQQQRSKEMVPNDQGLKATL